LLDQPLGLAGGLHEPRGAESLGDPQRRELGLHLDGWYVVGHRVLAVDGLELVRCLPASFLRMEARDDLAREERLDLARVTPRALVGP
jgi:hypothetical protein